MTNHTTRYFVAIGAVALGTLSSSVARADDTIKHPGDHPHYAVEIEPHLLLGWAANYYYGGGSGFGIGGRVSINLTHDGFVDSINNSVAIGLGLDWVHYDAPSCYYNYARGCYGGTSADFFQFPVVMQWNFYVARKWSVFGEPGLYIWHGTYGNGVCYNGPNPVPCSFSDTGVGPAFWIGGRYHFNENIALTMRLGYPDILTIGVSFMP
ncbi:MAG: outer membrane beta-barrel protein [Polyangiaceae bacterium]